MMLRSGLFGAIPSVTRLIVPFVAEDCILELNEFGTEQTPPWWRNPWLKLLFSTVCVRRTNGSKLCLKVETASIWTITKIYSIFLTKCKRFYISFPYACCLTVQSPVSRLDWSHYLFLILGTKANTSVLNKLMNDIRRGWYSKCLTSFNEKRKSTVKQLKLPNVIDRTAAALMVNWWQ